MVLAVAPKRSAVKIDDMESLCAKRPFAGSFAFEVDDFRPRVQQDRITDLLNAITKHCFVPIVVVLRVASDALEDIASHDLPGSRNPINGKGLSSVDLFFT